MIINESIAQKIEGLVALFLTKGVQPSDLADAIFEDDYESIEFVRKDAGSQAIVTFCDKEFDGIINKMRYHYDSERVLQQIDHKIGTGRYKQQWSRTLDIDQRINELSSLLGELNASEDVRTFLSSLPEAQKKSIEAKLRLVA